MGFSGAHNACRRPQGLRVATDVSAPHISDLSFDKRLWRVPVSRSRYGPRMPRSQAPYRRLWRGHHANQDSEIGTICTPGSAGRGHSEIALRPRLWDGAG